jgi:hypothetical protein
VPPYWLNLGSGDYPADPPWWNVDGAGCPHPVDETVDITGPLPPAWYEHQATRIYLGHVLEHLTIGEGENLLGRLHDVAADGCALMIVGPDVHRAEAMNRAGQLSDEWVRLVRQGGDRCPGDQHQWECEPQTLIRMCANAGWSNVREIPVELVPSVWPLVSDIGWQCAVEATA